MLGPQREWECPQLPEERERGEKVVAPEYSGFGGGAVGKVELVALEDTVGWGLESACIPGSALNVFPPYKTSSFAGGVWPALERLQRLYKY